MKSRLKAVLRKARSMMSTHKNETCMEEVQNIFDYNLISRLRLPKVQEVYDGNIMYGIVFH